MFRVGFVFGCVTQIAAGGGVVSNPGFRFQDWLSCKDTVGVDLDIQDLYQISSVWEEIIDGGLAGMAQLPSCEGPACMPQNHQFCLFAELAKVSQHVQNGGDASLGLLVEQWLWGHEGKYGLVAMSTKKKLRKQLPKFHHFAHGGEPYYFTQTRVPENLAEMYKSDGKFGLRGPASVNPLSVEYAYNSFSAKTYFSKYPFVDADSSIKTKNVIQMVVAGVHGSTSLEPVSAIKQIANVDATYFGHPCPGGQQSYLCEWRCEMLGICGDQKDAITTVLEQFVDDNFDERSWDVTSARELLRSFVRDTAAWAAADVVLCAGPYVLCAMLREADDPNRPYIIWNARHLLDGLMAQSADTQRSMMQLMKTFENDKNTHLAACEVYAAMQFEYVTGVRMPAVPRVASYLEFAPPSQSARRDGMLLWRSRVWDRISGITMKKVLSRIANDAGLRLSSSSHEEPRFLSYDEMRDDYATALLLPNDITMYALPELMRLDLWIFLPSVEMLHVMQASVPYGFMVHPASEDVLLSSREVRDKMPEPFWAPQGCHLPHFEYWTGVSDFNQITNRFDSLFSLVARAKLISETGLDARPSHRSILDEGIRNAHGFWRSVMRQVVDHKSSNAKEEL